MNHQEIEEQQVIDRYLMGRLPPEEATQFEQHYLHCSDCIDRLEVAEKVQRGLRRAVAQDATATIVAGRLGLLTRLARSRHRGWVAAAMVAVAVGLPTYLVYQHSARLSRDLDETRSTLAQQQQRETTDQTSADALAQELAIAQSELAAERLRFAEELGKEKKASQGLAERLARVFEPQLNLAVFSISPLRDAAFGTPTTPYAIQLSAEPEWIVLSLELTQPEYQDYRVILLRDDREVSRHSGLVPSHRDALVFSLHSTGLAAGDYLARVEGTPPGEEPVPVARFSFRVALGD